MQLSCILHKDIMDSVPFFKDKPKSFLAAICPAFRPMKVAKGEFIFMEGDPADESNPHISFSLKLLLEVFFLKSGQVAYVIPKYHNFKFLKIREGSLLEYTCYL